MSAKSLAVFISGHGSNLNVILQNKEKFRDLLVISSNPQAYGLTRAKNHGVDGIVLTRPIQWEALHEKLVERKVDYLFLAGFMRIVPTRFINLWEGRLFNLHPSMLPKYKGLHAIKQAYEVQDRIGVSIHYVIPEIDAGEVVIQEEAVSKEEVKELTLEEVTERTHQKEHELVQRWVDQFCGIKNS